MKSLNDIEKKNPFKVPDNYFEDFNARITEVTTGINEKKSERSLIRRLRPYFAAAASIAVIAVLVFTALYFGSKRETGLQFPEMSASDLPDSFLNDIDILTLEESIATSDIFREESGENNDDIIDYLVLENIDIYDIYEQL